MRNVRVFGPAYIDRVDRVDSPLLEFGAVDGSFEGEVLVGDGPSRIVDEAGATIVLSGENPGESAANTLIARIRGRLSQREGGWTRSVPWKSRRETLGGMGAGFAYALHGKLVCALGSTGSVLDDRGSWIERELASRGIAVAAIRVPNRESDWTWIVSSGGFGDKLAIGFRGCHAAVTSLHAVKSEGDCDLLVLAGFSNPWIAEALSKISARVRMLAPAMRNIRETGTPLASLAGRFDYLACNLREWEALENRGYFLEQTPIVSVTDGPSGVRIWFRDREEKSQAISLPAFPRDRPPLDTNRAGEAFAATLIGTLLDSGWLPGPIDTNLLRRAAERASVAAALVLDIEDFGFPTAEEIDRAWEMGRIVGPGLREG